VISCSTLRAHMPDLTRGTASDAVRLEAESHLESCAACRDERGVWAVLGALRNQRDAEPRLRSFAERRVLARLVEARAAGAPAPRSSRAPRLAIGLAAIALVAAGGTLVARVGGERLTALFRAAPAPVVVEGQKIEAAAPGAIAFSGAGVSYQPGTSLTFHPAARTVDVARGEADFDVDPKSGLPGHFRVTAKRLVVEVLGTRFVVTPTSVRTLRGRVRILDRAGHEVAVLRAGEWWSGADEPAAPTPPPVAPEAPEVVLEPAPVAAPVRAPSRAVAHVSVSELLAKSRAALAAGDAGQARALIERAFAAGPGEADATALELLRADALLVARRPDEAIVAYRRVARRRASAPEGETAAFAVGQLLFERGAESEAGAALYDYLARYPHGRFVREARERLTQLDAKP
jgi:hypothetical protein